MTSVRLELGPQGPISRFVCQKCGSPWFELVSLGIPGTGSSRCLKCGYGLANWAHEPQALSTGLPIVDTTMPLECAFGCGAKFPMTAEGHLALYRHEVLHSARSEEDQANKGEAP